MCNLCNWEVPETVKEGKNERKLTLQERFEIARTYQDRARKHFTNWTGRAQMADGNYTGRLEQADGSYAIYENGRVHNLSGPAMGGWYVRTEDGGLTNCPGLPTENKVFVELFYVNGFSITREHWQKMIRNEEWPL